MIRITLGTLPPPVAQSLTHFTTQIKSLDMTTFLLLNWRKANPVGILYQGFRIFRSDII